MSAGSKAASVLPGAGRRMQLFQISMVKLETDCAAYQVNSPTILNRQKWICLITTHTAIIINNLDFSELFFFPNA